MSFYQFSKVVVGFTARVLWRVRVYGAEHVPVDGSLIVACNHMSLVDPPVLGAFCPRKLHYMAKRELFAIPVLGPVIRSLGAYPVDRVGSARGAIKRSIEVLSKGESIGIFPEGGRNVTGLGEARAGVALLAALSRAPVVPAAIVGSNRAVALGRIQVHFGRPLRLNARGKASREELAKFTDSIMTEIRMLPARHARP